jgi:3-oxoacyl-[acyl-carrier-protein] synthase III
LFGSGDILKDAVRKVLEDAGLAVEDVDTLLGQTGNADLLVA